MIKRSHYIKFSWHSPKLINEIQYLNVVCVRVLSFYDCHGCHIIDVLSGLDCKLEI